MSLESGHHQVAVFSSESAIRQPGLLIAALLRDLVQSRQLALALAIRDLKAQYRQSLLGVLWAFGPPLFLTVMFTVARKNNLVNPGETHLPYSAYVLISTSLWQIFTAALTGPMNALQANKGILTRVRFPRESIILADLIKLAFTASIQFILIAAAFLWFKIPVTPAAILLGPLAVLALAGLGTTLGLFLAPIGTLYRDIANSMQVITVVWLTITPVAYPYPHYAGYFAAIVRWNPVSPLLVTARELISGESLTLLPNFFLVIGVMIPMLLLGLVILRISIPLLVERWSA